MFCFLSINRTTLKKVTKSNKLFLVAPHFLVAFIS